MQCSGASLCLFYGQEWDWGKEEKSRQKVWRGAGGGRGEELGEAEKPPKKASKPGLLVFKLGIIGAILVV